MDVQNRLLIGLFPTREVRAAIEAHRRSWWWPKDCSFPPVERLHLTLQYLPDSPGAAQRLHAALADVPMQPLELVLDSSCTWPNDVSVVRPAEHEALRILQNDVSRALLGAGFPLDVRVRGWAPHLTIARGSERAAAPMRLPPIRWTVKEFHLIRSHFRRPFRHEPLAAYSLHGSASFVQR